MTEIIQVQEGMVISLQFSAFEIESEFDPDIYDYYSGSGSGDYDYYYGPSGGYDYHDHDYEAICYDHLTITDGNGTTLMEKTCGSTLPPAIISSSNLIKIYFKTNRHTSRSGWSVNWSALVPGLSINFESSFSQQVHDKEVQTSQPLPFTPCELPFLHHADFVLGFDLR